MESKQKAYPDIWQSIGLFLINLGLLYAATTLMINILGFQLPLTALFLMGYLIAMALSVYIGRNFQTIVQTPLNALFPKVNFKVTLFIILATIAIDLGIIFPISSLIPISDFFKQSLSQNFGNLDIFMFIAMIFGAPFFEEYLYRGIILKGLLKNYSPFIAILISSILFGALHINPIQFVSATLGGLFLGWVYYKSKNLVYCMLIHLVINLTGFFLIRSIGIEAALEKNFIELSGGIGNAMMIIFVGVIVFAFSIFRLNKIFNSIKQ